ncbi:uncharacterized protein EV420DRAFT_1128413 [Desarmillaria tabescens]|uniref:Uncharacterized protein n=1 Tax=Armillaria tabescens TaxID=1929756 RepID=A0AA39JDN0_ARMTA|nr:uncharacterized protein EV420DRAFT_1128413 [Desarmillaria tabescens]KAK0440857.1 hypothetical protein EV420DRAFT_1128413 [Desarmillaria tabescens]
MNSDRTDNRFLETKSPLEHRPLQCPTRVELRLGQIDFILAPCINGRIRQNAVLEGCYSIYGDIFFVMYKVGSYTTILRCGDDTRQYYLFNFDTDKLYKFTKKYPTLEAFMERATLWINGDEQIYSVTPFAPAEVKAGRVSVRELELAWDLEEEAIEATS